jgi:hypothetical protein
VSFRGISEGGRLSFLQFFSQLIKINFSLLEGRSDILIVLYVSHCHGSTVV